MKYLLILPVVLLASCSRDVITTAHDLTIELVGTDAAYCIISTPDNRYALIAPGTTLVERDDEDLKIDCKDNLSDRRRTINIESSFSLGYWTYPETVTVDFSKISNGTMKNGFRADLIDENAKEILTEESYSPPVEENTIFEMETFTSEMSQDIVVENIPTNLVLENEIQDLKAIEMHSLEKIYKEQPHLKTGGRKSYPVTLD